MNHQRIGVLVIGQTPRADLTAPLEHLRRHYDLVVCGALDELMGGDLPQSRVGNYPLTTLLRDGTRVTIDEAFLLPLLQNAINSLGRDNVIAILLLCAGEFNDLVSKLPLLRPFKLALAVLRSAGMVRAGILVPANDQRAPAERKWKKSGLNPIIWSIEDKPDNSTLQDWLMMKASVHSDLDALVLDYVGYPIHTLRCVQECIRLPVLDLGHLAIAALESILSLNGDDNLMDSSPGGTKP